MGQAIVQNEAVVPEDIVNGVARAEDRGADAVGHGVAVSVSVSLAELARAGHVAHSGIGELCRLGCMAV